jgi:hypothetical protein
VSSTVRKLSCCPGHGVFVCEKGEIAKDRVRMCVFICVRACGCISVFVCVA